jgi:hypothetical protein
VPIFVRCLLIAFNFGALLLPPLLEPWLGAGLRPFVVTTSVVIAINAALAFWWDRVPAEGQVRRSLATPAFATGIGVVLLLVAARGWLHEILVFPHDPNRADMLVVIQYGIRRLLQGGDPYAMYNVPWPATLPYGPVMWAPMILPTLAHADVRFVTLFGFVFAAMTCCAAVLSNGGGRRGSGAAGWLIVLAAVAFSPDLRHFVSIGHTPAYWPLLGLFAFLVVREQWEAAAVAAGLLIVARTTMIAVAPVVLIAVWHRARPKIVRVTALMTAAVVIPVLPFAIWNWSSLKYGMYGSYTAVVKGYVWTSTTWAQRTIGITGPLLARGWRSGTQAVQVVVMFAVWAIAAVAIRAGRRPAPWMAIALLAFSMTTLWPVVYVYFDVFLLFAFAAAAESFAPDRGAGATWITIAAMSAAVVSALAFTEISAQPVIDAGTPAARPFLRAGFSGDEHDGARTFAWVDGTRADIALPRRSRSRATLVVTCQPNLPGPDAAQQMSAAVNGVIVGTVSLKDAWQDATFDVPERAWQIGVNDVSLFMSSAVSPREAGQGGDPRRLSVAIDRLAVQ